MVTLQQAAARLGVSERNVKRLIERKVLPAQQVEPCAPWEISLDALNSPAVQEAIHSTRIRKRPFVFRGLMRQLTMSQRSCAGLAVPPGRVQSKIIPI